MARNSVALAPARASNGSADAKTIRCAIYTRKSTEEGLQQEFNSLDAQREASEAFVASQKNEGWHVITDHFDDGGYTGGNMERPALKRLMAAVEARSVDCVVVYKVDRLSRSLLDFVRIIESCIGRIVLTKSEKIDQIRLCGGRSRNSGYKRRRPNNSQTIRIKRTRPPIPPPR
ncbi:MAG TPA: recombinase family protein [Bryobacteraceae bacterium]|jgi:hypothetical protein|nr:recombinase family protein [Bryobacteraceae bacterium]